MAEEKELTPEERMQWLRDRVSLYFTFISSQSACDPIVNLTPTYVC
jgi:hypothetical protein